MTPFWYVVIGFILCHVFWAAVFVVWWVRLVHNSGENVRQAINDDFQTVRASLLRAKKAGRNRRSGADTVGPL